MCGIAGFVNSHSQTANPQICHSMVDAIKHRGPDNQQVECWQNVGLGHARLSIIDLSDAAHQPMVSESGRYTIIYNGEIYNFRELRVELEQEGISFVSSSDTEVVLKAFETWGPDAFARFNGMFALAVLDRKAKRLIIARDRYGIKPLYYGFFGGHFLFGSEIKAIETHPEYHFDVNLAGVREYLTFQNFFSDQTLNANVRLFPSGHFAILSLEQPSQLEITQYWDFEFAEPERLESEDAYIEELDLLFQKALQRQFVSDVPLGSYLSGGMDSGSITSVAANHFDNLKTFNCGFEMGNASGSELLFDESQQALELSNIMGTTHFNRMIDSSAMESIIPSVVNHLEEPRVGQSYPNFYAAELASSEVKVVLSGAGGDELFAGYPWRYYRVLDCENNEDFGDRYFEYWQRLIPIEKQEQMLGPIWNQVKQFDVRSHFDSITKGLPRGTWRAEDAINAALYVDAKSFLHGLLVVEDKLSMAHSLEARVPFLDNDLVDFAQKIPARMKLNNVDAVMQCAKKGDQESIGRYCSDSADGKSILRRTMSRYLPDEIASRRKQGFSGPDASWFRHQSRDFVVSNLTGPNASISSLLDAQQISTTLENHFSGTENGRLLIWSMLSLEFWLRQHGVK